MNDSNGKHKVLDVYRITDYAIAVHLLNTCWDEIAEDNAPPYVPDLINEYWIGFGKKNVLFGGYRLHQINAATWQGHTFTLPEFRQKYAKEGCYSVLQWLIDNTDCKKLIADVPNKFINVQKFLEKIGFIKEGLNRESYTKDGILWDVTNYGLTRKEIEGLL